MDKKQIYNIKKNNLAESIESGEYFKEAREWYFYKFCKPISEKYFWLFLLISLLISIIPLYNEISAWYPLKNSKAIILLNKDPEYVQIVKKMENPDKNPDLAILRHLIKNYVQMREEYLPGSLNLLKIDNRLKKISNNSSREITKDFQNIFATNDNINPMLRLGKFGIREVEFLDFKIDVKEKSLLEKLLSNNYISIPNKATVIFKTEETIINKKNTEYWNLNIAFIYSGVLIDKEKKTLTLEEFTVTDYQKTNF